MFDRRGIGASDPVSLEVLPKWEEWTDDARAVMDAVGSERAALLGCGESGQTAILFAATNPDRAQFLVLFNSFARALASPDYPWGYSAEEAERLIGGVEAAWGLDQGEVFSGPVLVPPKGNWALSWPDRSADPVFTRWNAKNQRISCSPREVGVWLRRWRLSGVG